MSYENLNRPSTFNLCGIGQTLFLCLATHKWGATANISPTKHERMLAVPLGKDTI